MYTVHQTESFRDLNIASQSNGQAYDHTRHYAMPRMQRDTVSFSAIWQHAFCFMVLTVIVLVLAYVTIPAFRMAVNSMVGGY